MVARVERSSAGGSGRAATVAEYATSLCRARRYVVVTEDLRIVAGSEAKFKQRGGTPSCMLKRWRQGFGRIRFFRRGRCMARNLAMLLVLMK